VPVTRIRRELRVKLGGKKPRVAGQVDDLRAVVVGNAGQYEPVVLKPAGGGFV
jgi:hypothetical protein